MPGFKVALIAGLSAAALVSADGAHRFYPRQNGTFTNGTSISQLSSSTTVPVTTLVTPSVGVTSSAAGSTPAGSSPAGSTPAGSSPAGSTPAGSSPAGSTPVATVSRVSISSGSAGASTAGAAPTPVSFVQVAPGSSFSAANGQNWVSAGCFGASPSFTSAFTNGAFIGALTVQSCINACGTAEFTALTGTQCFCSTPTTSSINSLGLTPLDPSQCTVPVSSTAAAVNKRQAVPVGPISIFENTSNAIISGVPVPATTAPGTTAPATTGAIIGASTLPNPFTPVVIAAGSVYITYINNVYIDINAFGQQCYQTYQIPYTQTYCGCKADTVTVAPTATVPCPLTTLTKVISASVSGTSTVPASTVVVTVPVAVVTVGCSGGSCAVGSSGLLTLTGSNGVPTATVTAGKVTYTGAAAQVKAGVVGAGLAAIAAAVL